jgi:putative tricarboxylic transport membrane protein
MKINDVMAGLLFLALAAALASAAWGLPNPSAQPFGPGAFPILIAALMGLCAAILTGTALRNSARGPWIALADWTRSRAHVARFLLVPIAIAAYVLFVDEIGFLIVASAILLVLFLSGRVPVLRSIGLAAGVALLVHSLFYRGLSVQLPWGLLDPIRW